jgi:hypothetical protein
MQSSFEKQVASLRRRPPLAAPSYEATLPHFIASALANAAAAHERCYHMDSETAASEVAGGHRGTCDAGAERGHSKDAYPMEQGSRTEKRELTARLEGVLTSLVEMHTQRNAVDWAVGSTDASRLHALAQAALDALLGGHSKGGRGELREGVVQSGTLSWERAEWERERASLREAVSVAEGALAQARAGWLQERSSLLASGTSTAVTVDMVRPFNSATCTLCPALTCLYLASLATIMSSYL